MPFFTNGMDIFAHTLWTNMVFYKKYKREKLNRFIAVLFGILPDLCSFAPVFIYSFLARADFFDLVGRNIWVVRYASESYNYTHSIVIFTVALLFVSIARFLFYRSKNKSQILNTPITHGRERSVYFRNLVYWPMFGWLLHILIDIPTHKGFYETPFLFPLSGFKFSHGISWGHPTFMLINYSALAVVYILWFLVWRKQK